MLAGLIELVVDAINDVESLSAGDLAFDRAGHDHPTHLGLIEVGLKGFGGFDLAGALQYHLHPGLVPRNSCWIAVLGIADGVAIDLKAAACGVCFLAPAAVN